MLGFQLHADGVPFAGSQAAQKFGAGAAGKRVVILTRARIGTISKYGTSFGKGTDRPVTGTIGRLLTDSMEE
jgi:hypothetical protein